MNVSVSGNIAQVGSFSFDIGEDTLEYVSGLIEAATEYRAWLMKGLEYQRFNDLHDGQTYDYDHMGVSDEL